LPEGAGIARRCKSWFQRKTKVAPELPHSDNHFFGIGNRFDEDITTA